MAQRVLRERQEKRIQAKTPTTPSAEKTPPPPAAKKDEQQQPLHVSLRMASAKPFTRYVHFFVTLYTSILQPSFLCRSQLTERIKQQALLSAAQNYRTPAPLMSHQPQPEPPPAPVHKPTKAPPSSSAANGRLRRNNPSPSSAAAAAAPSVDRGEVRPVKSILKKSSTGADARKKSGRVNYAFDLENENKPPPPPPPKPVVMNGGSVHAVRAEVYTVKSAR